MNDHPFRVIALDGGAASGKSSTSRGVAERLHLLYVNSGEFYRAITYHCLEKDVHSKNEEEIKATLAKVSLESKIENGGVVPVLNGSVIPAEELRSPNVNANVSLYAAKRPIRNFLSDPLRDLVKTGKNQGYQGLIMEGRDIGTVIFPDADFKFFLSASEETREKRRESEGQMDLVVQRDLLDSKRSAAPFVPADRSIRINTDELELQEVIDLVCGIILTGRVPGTATVDPFQGTTRDQEGWSESEEPKNPYI